MKVEIPDGLVEQALAAVGLKLTGVINSDRSQQTALKPGCVECGKPATVTFAKTPLCAEHAMQLMRGKGNDDWRTANPC